MQIENFKTKIGYSSGDSTGFEIDHTIDGDNEVMIRIETCGGAEDIFLDPLTVRVMIEQLQCIQKQQEEK